MQSFKFEGTSIENLTVITPFYAPDHRGYLTKPFEQAIFAANGISMSPWEELRSYSHKGVLRGLHFQRRHSQDKLVRVLSGEVFDVAVDLRPDSPTFGRWQGFRLSGENRRMLYLPKDFAHGFLVLSQEAVLHYLCGDRYDPDSESGILWNDPGLAIHWPLSGAPILSPRDQGFQSFAAFRRGLELP